jgi:DNA polymerase-3 subunit beta
MKFTIDAKTFAGELDAVRKVINNKSTIPVLETVRVNVSEHGWVTLTGTDLEQTLIATFRADDTEAGCTLLGAKALSDMTKPLTGSLSVSVSGEMVNISCGKVSIKLAINDPLDFPETPDITIDKTAIVSSERLQSMAKNVIIAVSKEVTRFTLEGAKAEIVDGHIRLISTDGHRMAYADSNNVKGDLSWPRESSILIRSEALKLFPQLSGESVTIAGSGQYIHFISGNRTLITRIVAGTFPKYEMVLPKEFAATASFNVDIMRQAVKRASVAANPRTHSITLNMRPNEIELQTESDESAIRCESVDVVYSGDDGIFSFNGGYLLDSLTAIKQGEATISMNDPLSQVQISPVGYDYDLRYIVMPLRP